MYTDLDKMLANPDILAVDVVTDPSIPPSTALATKLERGLSNRSRIASG